MFSIQIAPVFELFVCLCVHVSESYHKSKCEQKENNQSNKVRLIHELSQRISAHYYCTMRASHGEVKRYLFHGNHLIDFQCRRCFAFFKNIISMDFKMDCFQLDTTDYKYANRFGTFKGRVYVATSSSIK